MAERMLVVVDYQKDFVDGALGFPGAEKLDAGIAEKIQEASRRGDDIVVTLDTHPESYLETREGRALPAVHCVKGTDGWQLYGKTADAVAAAREQAKTTGAYCGVWEKTTFGLAPESVVEIRKALAKEPREIELVGLVSNICVLSNVCCLQAAFPEAQLVVDSRLTASFDPQLHQKTMDVLRGIQVQIL